MTDKTPAAVIIEWEPITEGIELFLRVPHWKGTVPYRMPMMSVRELRDDMEEAIMLGRGCEKVECFAHEVQQYDKVYIAGHVRMVSDVLASEGSAGPETVLQFGSHFTEVAVPSDDVLTVWRPVE